MEKYERVLVFGERRAQFFRKMIRFLDKYHRLGSLGDVAPYIAT